MERRGAYYLNALQYRNKYELVSPIQWKRGPLIHLLTVYEILYTPFIIEDIKIIIVP